MAAPKNHAKAGGRKKGVPNKTTQDMRDTIQKIVDGEIPSIKAALKKLKDNDPDKYLALLDKYMTYVLPKKRDITSDDKPIGDSAVIILPSNGREE